MLFNSESVQAVATGFKGLFMEGLAVAALLYKDLCFDLPSTGHQETLSIPEGLGDLVEWTGSREIDVPIRWTETIINKDWQKTIAVPRNAYEDDNLGLYASQAKMLGINAASHPDSLLASAIIAGFSGTSYDGVAFFSATHPLDGEVTGNTGSAGVQSNIEAGALSATTYRSALSKIQSMKDYFGKPLRFGAMGMKFRLMVGPSNRATAVSIVGVQTTASGAGNPDFGTAEVVINEYFTGAYANYWCVTVVGGPIYPFIFQMRRKPALTVISDPDSEEVFKNKRILHGVDGRWNLGYGFYQLIVGSTGS